MGPHRPHLIEDADMLKTAAILLFAIPALAGPGYGQTNPAPESARVTFIDMSEMQLSANGTKVPALYVTVEQREKFGKLLRLKRSVLPKMKATAKDVALR